MFTRSNVKEKYYISILLPFVTLCIDIITIFVVHRSFRNKYDSTNKISFLQPLKALCFGTFGQVFSEEKSLENVDGRTTTDDRRRSLPIL